MPWGTQRSRVMLYCTVVMVYDKVLLYMRVCCQDAPEEEAHAIKHSDAQCHITYLLLLQCSDKRGNRRWSLPLSVDWTELEAWHHSTRSLSAEPVQTGFSLRKQRHPPAFTEPDS